MPRSPRSDFFLRSDLDSGMSGEAAESNREWRARAEAVLPGGASTGSKRADALYGPDTDFGPTHYSRAAGCRVLTTAGEELVDCTMSLGAVAIGYADEVVTAAVADAAARGNVSGLSHALEVTVAERLCDVVPCAEAVRFLKTGAEGVAAAVRIARRYTGRKRVVGCGYFGWLDWCTSDDAGVPAGARADFTAVPFDDLQALRQAAESAAGDLAAIVIEPVVEKLPTIEWLQDARDLCDRLGAVLIYDEIKTGFRIATGGLQSHSDFADVTPDMAVFAKAFANGFPLAAVVGNAAVMDAARSTWISSTLAGEAVALAAANAVLDWHERAEVCEGLAEIGEEMRSSVARSIAASRISGVALHGLSPMWFLRFDDPARESRFLELALERGVLFKRGPYNFASLAHDESAIAAIENAASSGFVQMREEDDSAGS
ncbi:MAG: aminotransferase class III-fold pyridoxal phosphate-dependent enzyme [Gemmatimonadaceae bacterium]